MGNFPTLYQKASGHILPFPANSHHVSNTVPAGLGGFTLAVRDDALVRKVLAVRADPGGSGVDNPGIVLEAAGGTRVTLTDDPTLSGIGNGEVN